MTHKNKFFKAQPQNQFGLKKRKLLVSALYIIAGIFSDGEKRSSSTNHEPVEVRAEFYF